MSLPSDWKMGKFLDWYTELPFHSRPRKSPIVMFQNIECHFELRRENFYDQYNRNYKYRYVVCVKCNADYSSLKSFSLVIYSDCCESGTFKRYDKNFPNGSGIIFTFYESTISDRGSNFGCGYFVRFIFLFGMTDAPLITKIDERSTQADLMLSLQTDTECLPLDLGHLLQTNDHSDVQLQCNGGSIPAHRAILAARSRAFSDMFQDGTSESQSGQVNLTATDTSVMRLCLEFIYTGKIEEVPIETAKSLYVLGYDLKIPSLAKKCADLMVCNATEENYIPYLSLADNYNDDHFKCGLGDYVSDHTDLLKTEKWIKFSHEHPKTAVDVYQKCMFK